MAARRPDALLTWDYELMTDSTAYSRDSGWGPLLSQQLDVIVAISGHSTCRGRWPDSTTFTACLHAGSFSPGLLKRPSVGGPCGRMRREPSRSCTGGAQMGRWCFT